MAQPISENIVTESQTQICNDALDLLNHTNILSIDITVDSGPVAKKCSTQYPKAKQKVLRSANWGFAKKEARLTKLGTSDSLVWGNSYTKPPDFIKLVSVDGNKTNLHYQIRGNSLVAQTGSTFSDLDAVDVEYVANVQEGFFTDEFVEALVFYLAHRLGGSIRGTDIAVQMFQLYKESLKDAKGIETTEDRAVPPNRRGSLFNSIFRTRRA